MKPMKIVLSATTVVVALSAQAETGFHFKPYVGLDYQHISLSYADDDALKINEQLVGHEDNYSTSDLLPTQLNGGVVYFGTRLNDHFGIEAGFAQTVNAENKIAKEKAKILYSEIVTGSSKYKDYIDKIDAKGRLKMRSIYLDALGYLPLDSANRFELIGSIGIAQVKTQAKVSGEVTVPAVPSLSGSGELLTYNDSETDIRLGFGAQYQVVKNLNVRGMVRYQGLDLNAYGKGAYQVNLGLNYAF